MRLEDICSESPSWERQVLREEQVELGSQGTHCPKLGLGAEPMIRKKGEMRHKPTPAPLCLELVASSLGLWGGISSSKGGPSTSLPLEIWRKPGCHSTGHNSNKCFILTLTST